MASLGQRTSTCGLRVSAPLQTESAVGDHKRTSSHPTEPQCSYDPVEGLTLAPDTNPVEKIKELEEQISE